MKSISLLLVLFAFASCDQLTKNDSEIWVYSTGYTRTGNADTMLTAANFLFLGQDGQYTRDFGTFDHGQWKVQDKKLVLDPSDNLPVEVLPMTIRSESEVKIQLGDVTGLFRLLPSSGDVEESPYALQYNNWRIHPIVRESDELLYRRLRNHCKFWETYFTWALRNNLTNLDVRNTPTCVKIYGNGFGLYKFDELTPKWQNCFYDSTDCRKADAIIKKIFRQNSIDWPKTDNNYRRFVSAFNQLGKFLK